MLSKDLSDQARKYVLRQSNPTLLNYLFVKKPKTGILVKVIHEYLLQYVRDSILTEGLAGLEPTIWEPPITTLDICPAPGLFCCCCTWLACRIPTTTPDGNIVDVVIKLF